MREIILSDFEEGVDSPQWTAHSATDRGTVRDCRKQSRDSQKTVRDSQKNCQKQSKQSEELSGTVKKQQYDGQEAGQIVPPSPPSHGRHP